MKLNKQDEYQIMLFEEYIDALIDRRTHHMNFPESSDDYEDKNVAACKSVLLNEVFKSGK